MAETSGIGLTVTTTFIGDPVHPFALGVIVYVAVPGVVPVAVRDCTIEVPLPLDAPLTPDCTTIQLYDVPATDPDNEIFVDEPEHNVSPFGVATTFGVGLTVIANV